MRREAECGLHRHILFKKHGGSGETRLYWCAPEPSLLWLNTDSGWFSVPGSAPETVHICRPWKRLPGSNADLTDRVMDSPQDQEPHRLVQDTFNQNPECVKQEQIQDQVQDKENNVGNEAKEQKQWDKVPSQYQLEVHLPGQSPAEDDPRAVDRHQLVSDEDLLRDHVQAEHQDQQDQEDKEDQEDQEDQAPMSAAANQDRAGESGGSYPVLVISEAEEPPAFAALLRSPANPAEPSEPQRPADPVFTDAGVSSSPDGGDMVCSDLLSLRSDSLSLAGELAVSRTSEEDDTRSVTASSFLSLFHRLQLDPLDKDWLKSSALGDMAAQRQLLDQDPSLVFRKNLLTLCICLCLRLPPPVTSPWLFTKGTALHWAAKQGSEEAVEMMLRFGADVNVRSHVSDFLNP
ncbi:hypothetical protein Q5P01_013073 [Channa striata]|uniref:Uncharacterized protein n=1 Tax=Channa striata TaxID=64152 RepID=A0AA88SNQ2_CHASR|nr:hypothetical protein Q5P01_013073 [Channa striata]